MVKITPNKGTLETIQRCLSYCPETGEIRWSERPTIKGKVIVGDIAGTPHKKGYWTIGINYQRFLAHNIAWFLYTGEWPEGPVDHEDRNKLDNRASNLRLCNYSQNNGNTFFVKGKVPFRGVSPYKNTSRYRAQISVNNKTKHLGMFSTAEEAARAYDVAAAAHFGEFATFNFGIPA